MLILFDCTADISLFSSPAQWTKGDATAAAPKKKTAARGLCRCGQGSLEEDVPVSISVCGFILFCSHADTLAIALSHMLAISVLHWLAQNSEYHDWLEVLTKLP